MAKVYQFMADGLEEIEALIVTDILRRGGVDIQMVSINGTDTIKSAHGVEIKCDAIFENVDTSDADMLLIPGGIPGTPNLMAHEGVCNAMKKQYEAGKKVGAICAAPMLFGKIGILNGKRATCYPGCQDNLGNATYTQELVTIDGNIITGEGPAAAFPYGYAILEMLTDKQTVDAISEGMRYNHLMNK